MVKRGFPRGVGSHSWVLWRGGGRPARVTLRIDQQGRPRLVDLPGVVHARGGDGSDSGAVEVEGDGDSPPPSEILVQPRDLPVVRDGRGPVPAVFRVQALAVDTDGWSVVRRGVTNRIARASGETLRFEDVQHPEAPVYFGVLAGSAGRVEER